jgi:dTDP-glucose 4,6-dehydratase
MKRLLITGGAGFIGSEFTRQAVKRGYRAVVIDKLTYAGDLKRLADIEKDISFYKTDISNKEFIEHVFKTEKPDAVIHWAAESHVDKSIMDATDFLHTNILGTEVLLKLSLLYGIEKFINISTDEVYGELQETGQFYETTSLNPNSPYSVSKGAADMLGRAYHRTFGLPVITVRPSNNYGPWQYPEKLIPVVILKALNNEKIPVYGAGQNVREWLFVSDCADAVFKILEQGQAGEIYNVGSGEEKKNLDVVQDILKILGKLVPESLYRGSEDLIEFVQDRPGHDFRYSLNSDKISEKLGWKKKTSFEKGIEDTVRWYIDNIEWAKSKLKNIS